jgi:hypothetical protein
MTSTDDFDRQDIRLAVVLNSGVSLAIWTSGATLEAHQLAIARRWDKDNPPLGQGQPTAHCWTYCGPTPQVT